MYSININQKEATVAILMSGKVDSESEIKKDITLGKRN